MWASSDRERERRRRIYLSTYPSINLTHRLSTSSTRGETKQATPSPLLLVRSTWRPERFGGSIKVSRISQVDHRSID